jgi:hypothetical protein
MITEEGRVKVLDFGLAKLIEPQPGDASSKLATESVLTGHGAIVGTVPYMSPEQIEAKAVDHRTDIFSLGTILYEMATASRPFRGETSTAVISAILKESPSPVTEKRAELPRRFGRLIDRCLEKNPERRPGTAAEVHDALRTLQHDEAHGSKFFRRAPVLLGAAALAAVLLSAGWMLIQRNRALAFQADAMPRLAQLALTREFVEAFELAREVERITGPGKVADEMWKKISRTVSVTSEPPEATVSVQPFGGELEPRILGDTPLTEVRVARGPMHWRVQHKGYVPAEFVSIYGPSEPFVLLPESDRDLDMFASPAPRSSCGPWDA